MILKEELSFGMILYTSTINVGMRFVMCVSGEYICAVAQYWDHNVARNYTRDVQQ